MSKIRWSVQVNLRAFEWMITLARRHFKKQEITNGELTEYIELLLLRQLQQTPEVDLSQSPYSQPKGVSNEQSEKRRI